jgi:hypothetical protein
MRHVLMYQSAFPILVPGNGSAGEGRIAMRPAASDIYGFGGGGPIALRPDIIDRLDPSPPRLPAFAGCIVETGSSGSGWRRSGRCRSSHRRHHHGRTGHRGMPSSLWGESERGWRHPRHSCIRLRTSSTPRLLDSSADYCTAGAPSNLSNASTKKYSPHITLSSTPRSSRSW